MALERTLAIAKPDAVKRGLTGEIISRIHKAGFSIVAIKSVSLSKAEAEGFYAVHKARPFFGELTDFMSSGKAIFMVLEADGAISEMARNNGRHRSRKGRSGLDSPRPRHEHRQQLHARLRRSRHRRFRDRLFLLRHGIVLAEVCLRASPPSPRIGATC